MDDAIQQFIKAVVAYDLRPNDLLPVIRIVGGEETISIQFNGVLRTYDASTDWSQLAISHVHAGVWGPRPN